MTLSVGLLCGLPVGYLAAGKRCGRGSLLRSRHGGEVVRVNRDALRRMALPRGYSKPEYDAEELITLMQRGAIRALLAAGHGVVCDDTNFGEEHVSALRGLAAFADANVELVDFTDVPLAECIRRDARRPRRERVGEVAIRALHERFYGTADGSSLDVVTRAQGADSHGS